jgi:serine/threonine protein kinase
MAPEVNQKQYEGKGADLFAAGIILFLLYTGIPPF